jgi:hypothetical protein
MNFQYRDQLASAPFWSYLNARHAIFLRKQAGTTPLTEDPIFAEYSFCNVFRELDRVTIWVRENIREPFADHPNLWFMLAIARYINWPPTLQAAIDAGAWPTSDNWRPEQLAEVLQARATDGEKVYTGAYTIRAEGNKKAPWFGSPKHRYVSEIYLGRLWNDRRSWEAFFGGEQRSLRDTWLRFHPYVGWGPSFMAYEVVTDLRHTRYLRGAPDIMTWANTGPGAQRGLNRLLGRPLNASVKDRAVTLMRTLLAEQDQCRGEHVPPLEMRDIEHTLCEFDKYTRVKNGEGRPRNRYVPGRGY